MDRLANYILLAFAIIISFILTLWSIDDDPPTTFREEKIIKDVSPGERAVIDYIITRHRNTCRTNVDRFVFDGNNVRIPLEGEDSFQVNPGPIGDDEFQEYVLIPEWATPGNALYRTIRVYQCNPLQRLGLTDPIIVRTPDVKFKILEKQNVHTP